MTFSGWIVGLITIKHDEGFVGENWDTFLWLDMTVLSFFGNCWFNLRWDWMWLKISSFGESRKHKTVPHNIPQIDFHDLLKYLFGRLVTKNFVNVLLTPRISTFTNFSLIGKFQEFRINSINFCGHFVISSAAKHNLKPKVFTQTAMSLKHNP